MTFHLHSTGLIHTPGILAWAINGYKFKKDRKRIMDVFKAGFEGQGMSEEVMHKLLAGEIPFKVEGSTVVLEVNE